MPPIRSVHLYWDLFLHDGADLVGPLIEAIRARREQVVQEWHSLYALRFGAHRAISDKLFQETYGPNLRAAVMGIVRGDTFGFVSSAAGLGKQLASEGVPFAALVSHLSLWKESCTKALADDLGQLCAALIILDKLSCCFVSAAADGYYGRLNDNEEVEADTATSACEQSAASAGSGVFYGLVGQSSALRRVFEQVRRIGPTNTPVLIVGETGTGKELAAHAMHECGARRAGPFVAVNCAALPRDLIESELFGYKRGAFSGATGDYLGLFRTATGGTLLLDEVTEMSLELQAKLLRVLQERTVRPVGAVNEVAVDVRIIASTNREPAAALSSGSLRKDLYYRLCGSTIKLPALRDRIEDIVLLVEHHLSVLNARYGQAGPARRGMTPAAMEALLARAWPGNVRELFNVVESAFTSTQSPHIGVADLEGHAAVPRLREARAPGAGLSTYRETERALIEQTLASTGGNKLLAARRLGISRKKLYSRLAKYALP